MNEPRTEAGRRLLADLSPHWVNPADIVAIEAEASRSTLDVEQQAIANCIDIVQQSLDTVRHNEDRGVTANNPWINGNMEARAHVIRLLTGYQDAAAARREEGT